jgi:hypothetical protein
VLISLNEQSCGGRWFKDGQREVLRRKKNMEEANISHLPDIYLTYEKR